MSDQWPGRVSGMVGKRKYEYDDGCPVAHGLDLIGERWALLVVRELLLGPKRFTDLRAGLPGASPDVLSQRLRELQDAGVLRHRRLAPPAGSWVYELTDWGLELEPIVMQLGRWAGRSPATRPEAPVSVDSLVLSLKGTFDSAAAAELTVTIALRLGEHDFGVRVADGGIYLARGSIDRPQASLHTDSGTLLALLTGERSLDQARRAGDLNIDGDAAAAARFLALFPVPEQTSPRSRP